MSSRAILRTLVDVLTVFGRLHLTNHYRRAATVPAMVVDMRPVEIRTRAAASLPRQRTAGLPVASAA